MSIYERTGMKFSIVGGGTVLLSFMLVIPVSLFSAMGYDINLAILLAPLVAAAFLISLSDQTARWFGLALAAGASAIVIANIMEPDGELLRHFLSLVLLMAAASFYFLGLQHAHRVSIADILYWLAVASSIFTVAVAARLLLVGGPFRVEDHLGRAILNANFLGLPVFGVFGVNTLAHQLCIQCALIGGAVLGLHKRFSLDSLLFSLGTVAASYLIFSSSARSAQIFLMLFLLGLLVLALAAPRFRNWQCALAVAALTLGCLVAVSLGTQARLVTTLEEVLTIPSTLAPGEESTQRSDLSYVEGDPSNGRGRLASTAIKQFLDSPFVGTGFAGYSRMAGAELDPILRDNSTTHIYYLTVLWKGGLIFSVPFFLFMIFGARQAVSVRRVPVAPQEVSAAFAVIITFGFLAMTWDILNVPSAGAVAWYLLGMLGGAREDVHLRQTRASAESSRRVIFE